MPQQDNRCRIADYFAFVDWFIHGVTMAIRGLTVQLIAGFCRPGIAKTMHTFRPLYGHEHSLKAR